MARCTWIPIFTRHRIPSGESRSIRDQNGTLVTFIRLDSRFDRSSLTVELIVRVKKVFGISYSFAKVV
jgi:hypothetical protein